jgi:hypothetical protein
MKDSKTFGLLTAAAVAVLLTTFAVATASAQTITRGPYLQMPGPDRMTVIFHTDIALTGAAEVDYGTSVALGTSTPGLSSADLMGGFKHVVELSGLTDFTKYFYAVGDSGGPLTVAGDDYAFTTSPLPGTRQPIRIWTFGDSGYWPGNNGTEFLDSRQAYYDHVGGGDVNVAADATDVMMYLGDNAYGVGDDPTYQSVFFSPPELAAFLRRQPFLSAIGNHEGAALDSVTQTGDYFDMFNFPTGNELGTNGVASGSEAYYSYDYGNIHFIVLDTEDNIGNISTTGAAMKTWLENDLIATTADWIIAAWHRPPYSKGIFHDSDLEANEVAAREEFLPILEDYGVDLVLSGHSHTYERTPLVDGHIGLSTTLEPYHILDGGDGNPLSDGPYRKPSLQQAPHEGAVYIVTGAAADKRAFLPAAGHPLMVKKFVFVGTSVIEVDGDVLTGKFINDAGAVLDTFEIDKGVDNDCPVAPLGTCLAAGKAKFAVKTKSGDPSKDQTQWKWSKVPLEEGDMDPTFGTDLLACAWDDTGAVYDILPPNPESLSYPPFPTTPPPSWEWLSKKAGQHQYKDKLGSVDGLTKIKTKAKADSKGKLQFKSKGAATAPPTLPLTGPLTIQLINLDTGTCWGATLVEKKNDGSKYSASGP